MGIRVTRFPDFDLTLHIFSGLIRSEEMLRHFSTLGAADGGLWLSYLDESADMSGIDVARLPELKRTIADKQKELFEGRPVFTAIVCSSAACEAYYRFWRTYVRTGEDRPATPSVFSDYEAACDWLKLTEAAREACWAEISATKPAWPSATSGQGRRTRKPTLSNPGFREPASGRRPTQRGPWR